MYSYNRRRSLERELYIYETLTIEEEVWNGSYVCETATLEATVWNGSYMSVKHLQLRQTSERTYIRGRGVEKRSVE